MFDVVIEKDLLLKTLKLMVPTCPPRRVQKQQTRRYSKSSGWHTRPPVVVVEPTDYVTLVSSFAKQVVTFSVSNGQSTIEIEVKTIVVLDGTTLNVCLKRLIDRVKMLSHPCNEIRLTFELENKKFFIGLNVHEPKRSRYFRLNLYKVTKPKERTLYTPSNNTTSINTLILHNLILNTKNSIGKVDHQNLDRAHFKGELNSLAMTTTDGTCWTQQITHLTNENKFEITIPSGVIKQLHLLTKGLNLTQTTLDIQEDMIYFLFVEGDTKKHTLSFNRANQGYFPAFVPVRPSIQIELNKKELLASLRAAQTFIFNKQRPIAQLSLSTEVLRINTDPERLSETRDYFKDEMAIWGKKRPYEDHFEPLNVNIKQVINFLANDANHDFRNIIFEYSKNHEMPYVVLLSVDYSCMTVISVPKKFPYC